MTSLTCASLPPRPAWADGLDLTILAHRQSYVVRRVRQGIPVLEAAAEVYISRKTVQHWRDRTPGFAERLDQAKRDASVMRKRRLQQEFLLRVQGGESIAEALRAMGLHGSTAQNWRRDGRTSRGQIDTWFDREYRRLIGPTGKTGNRFNRLLVELRAGASMHAACQAAGYDVTAPYCWKARTPDIWALVENARAIGQSSTPPEQAARPVLLPTPHRRQP